MIMNSSARIAGSGDPHCGAFDALVSSPTTFFILTTDEPTLTTPTLTARPFGASILDLGPRLQILDPPLTDTGQLTLITETELTLTLALTLTDTVMLISQYKLSIYLSIFICSIETIKQQLKRAMEQDDKAKQHLQPPNKMN